MHFHVDHLKVPLEISQEATRQPHCVHGFHCLHASLPVKRGYAPGPSVGGCQTTTAWSAVHPCAALARTHMGAADSATVCRFAVASSDVSTLGAARCHATRCFWGNWEGVKWLLNIWPINTWRNREGMQWLLNIWCETRWAGGEGTVAALAGNQTTRVLNERDDGARDCFREWLWLYLPLHTASSRLTLRTTYVFVPRLQGQDPWRRHPCRAH